MRCFFMYRLMQRKYAAEVARRLRGEQGKSFLPDSGCISKWVVFCAVGRG